ncbi:MAG: tetratricopeptide repeat protein [Methanosarcinales archaeon]|nr:tetratricopeptide repeat protein [Methanosarcinales archaeon]
MDQLVVLHEIFESFAKDRGSLHAIDPKSIEGSCASQVRRLLEGAQQGEIDAEFCAQLLECLTDIYEIKRLGDICRRAGLFEVAVKCYNQALSQGPDSNVRSVLLNNLGQVYAREGDLGKAVLYYRKAAEGFEQVGNASGVAHVLGNLGSAYRRGYEWDRAVEHCFKSLRAFEKLGDEFGVAQIMGSLGRLYAEMGERDLAVRYYEKSLREFERLGDKKNAAWLLNRLGKSRAKAGSWEEATRCFTRSLAIFDELGMPHNSGIVLTNLGRMYLDQGLLELATETLEKGLKLIGREMLPAYPNAVAALAASNSTMARQYLQEFIRDDEIQARRGGGPAQGANELVTLSSQLYASSSDRYQELTTIPRITLGELKVASSQARSLSYLARLHDPARERERVALAERAISALQLALANSGGHERIQIAAVQRSLQGMKELWSMAGSQSEPWKLVSMLAAATEYLIGGARDLCDATGGAGEACRCIYDALQSIGSAIEEERQRRDPAARLEEASANLRRAGERLLAAGTGQGSDGSARMTSAAQILDNLVVLCREAGSDRPTSGGSGTDRVSNLLNYGAHQEALLQIGWTLVENGMARTERAGYVYIWDDAMNLAEVGPAGSPSSRQRINRSRKGVTEEEEMDVDPIPAGQMFSVPIAPAKTMVYGREEIKGTPQSCTPTCTTCMADQLIVREREEPRYQVTSFHRPVVEYPAASKECAVPSQESRGTPEAGEFFTAPAGTGESEWVQDFTPQETPNSVAFDERPTFWDRAVPYALTGAKALTVLLALALGAIAIIYLI